MRGHMHLSLVVVALTACALLFPAAASSGNAYRHCPDFGTSFNIHSKNLSCDRAKKVINNFGCNKNSACETGTSPGFECRVRRTSERPATIKCSRENRWVRWDSGD